MNLEVFPPDLIFFVIFYIISNMVGSIKVYL